MNTVLAGVLLQLSALALFVAMDTLLKLLTLSFAVPQLMWARFLFSFIAVTIAMIILLLCINHSINGNNQQSRHQQPDG